MSNFTLIFPNNSPGITKGKEYGSVYSDAYNDRHTIIDDNGDRRVFWLGRNPVIQVIQHKDDE